MKELYHVFRMILLFLLTTGAVTAQTADEYALQSITPSELKDHIYFLASDFLNGRAGPSAEYEIAAQYVASQFAAAGLQPLLEDEAGHKTYFQPVPFLKETYLKDVQILLKSGEGETEMEMVRDFKIQYMSRAESQELDIVFAGYGIEEPDNGWNDYEDLDIAGKLVVLIDGAPLKKEKPVLPAKLHEKYTSEQGMQLRMGSLMQRGPAAVAFIPGPNNEISWDQVRHRFSRQKYNYQSPGEKKSSGFSFPNILSINPEVTDLLFANQKYAPSQIAEKGMKGYTTFVLEEVKAEIRFPETRKEEVFLKNVVGYVPGTDPELAGEYIVVGAHLDHVKPVNGEVCNGADDNASGSAGVIEVAEALALNPGRRPVVFVTYTAEEMGLCGSNYFVNSGDIDWNAFKFNINLDMIGRSDEKNAETKAHYAVTNKKYLQKIESFVQEINQSSLNYPILFDNDEDSPGGSDHMSFMQKNIPAFFFFSGVHEDLHRPGDDPEKIDYEKATAISRLTYLLAIRLANMEIIPDFLAEEKE